MDTAGDRDFPTRTLALTMQERFAPRILKKTGHFSYPIQPQRSMIAGVRSAVDLSRCVLYRALGRMRMAHRSVPTRSWVDDLNTRIAAPPDTASRNIAGVSKVLADARKDLDLTILRHQSS